MGARDSTLVFLGMDSVYSTRVLAALHERGYPIRAVIKPLGSLESRRQDVLTRSSYFKSMAGKAVQKLRPSEPNVSPEETDPFSLAVRLGCPCYLVGNASGPKAEALLRDLAPDLICIAFFNQLLKPRVLGIPRLGVLNAHPSLLPRYRGPSPLFWMFHDGVEMGGVSIHLVTAGEDAGDVLYRAEAPIPVGIRGPDYLSQLAEIAARLMVRAVDDMVAGTVHAEPQDSTLANRAGRPTEEDFEVRFDQPAARVFGLVRGLAQWAPLWCDLGGARYRVMDALAYESDATLEDRQIFTGTQVAVRCQGGVVVLSVRPLGASAGPT